MKKIFLDSINMALVGQYDLFICSSSFEERCLSIAKKLNDDIFSRALIMTNIDLMDYVRENSNILIQMFSEKSTFVEISTKDQLLTADNIDKALSLLTASQNISRIILDITSFTHESLLILLQLLRIKCTGSELTIVYANAQEYSIGEHVKYKWLSRGVGEVRTVLGYPGNLMPSRQTHLIVIVGYEYERAMGLIEILEPNSLALGYGRSQSATTEKDKSANVHYHRLVKDMASSYYSVNSFTIQCDDPEGTRDELLKQVMKVPGKNIIIAPMNNKLSTIGAAMVGFEKEDIQICYAQALQYNYSAYSKPGSYCYILDLSSILRDGY